jgi:hypothetical protein
MSITRCLAPGSLCLRPGRPERRMSDDAKLGLILLFMVFALMVIGPVLAG